MFGLLEIKEKRMKKLLSAAILLVFSIPVLGQDAEVVRLSEPVQVTEDHEVFGSEVEQWDEPQSLKNIIESADELAVQEITMETEVAQVCQKKGCFFVANEGSYTARITFKDYSFFIPTDSKGKKVKLIGTFEVKELTEDQAKHYAEDAGDDPELIKGSQKEYSIVATSVMIPRS